MERRPLFYTPGEFAVLLKVSQRTVRRWIRKGQLQARRFGRQLRIPIRSRAGPAWLWTASPRIGTTRKTPRTIGGGSIMAYQRGDVVLVPFPFTDLSATKTRPAVVVSVPNFEVVTGNFSAAMITSIPQSTP